MNASGKKNLDLKTMILKGEGVKLDALAAKMLLFENAPIANADTEHVFSPMSALLPSRG